MSQSQGQFDLDVLDYSNLEVGESPVPPLSKIVFIPEINFWGLQIISKSPVYQEFKNYPIPVKESEWRRDGSILDLLFDYTFDSSGYSIYYQEVQRQAITDTNIIQRSPVRASRLQYYVCDTSSVLEVFPESETDFGEGTDIIGGLPAQPHCPGITPPIIILSNIFNITTGEKDLLDLLFLYKTEIDITSIFNQIDYNKLASPFSKLIYIYLDIEINNNYYLYDNDTPINNEDRLIVWLYEKFVMDHLYRKLMLKPAETKGSYYGPTDSTSEEPRLQIINIQTKTYRIPNNRPPIGEDYIFLVHKGIYQVLHKNYEYQQLTQDSTSEYLINWQGKHLEDTAEVNDKIYLLWGYSIEEEINDVQCL